MKLKFFFACAILLFSLALSALAGAKGKKGETLDSIARKYSLDQLEQSANYMLARVEADPLPKGKKIISCDPPIEKINTWLAGTVRALIDEKRTAELESYKKDPASFAKRLRGCADRCTCNPYAAMFEEIGDAGVQGPLGTAHSENVALLKKEMRLAGKDQSMKCAKTLSWFCSSPLHEFLKKSN